MGPTWDLLVLDFHCDFHISFNNSYSNKSTLNAYESEYYNSILKRFGWMRIWDVLTWDPLVPNFHHDFHISFNNSCSNSSILNECESEYKN